MHHQNLKNTALLLANIIFAILVFIADLYLPTQISVEIPYIAVVISSALCTGNNYYVKYFAFLCSAFIIVDYIFIAVATTVPWEELLQRIEILVVIWVTTSILYLEKNAHIKLQNSAAKQLAIFDSSSNSVLAVNTEGTILSSSTAIKTMFYWDVTEIVNQSLFVLITDQFIIPFKEYFSSSIKENGNTHNPSIEVKVVRKDKQEFLCSIKISKVNLPKDEQLLFTVTFDDITERKKSEEKLIWLATHDELTNVYNRRFFNTHLTKEWQTLMRNELPISLIMIDVDFFKQYNDTLGHPEGDNCLKLIAQEIQNQLKRPTDFLARYGGEEFAVVLPDTNINGAIYIAQKFKESVYNLKIPHPHSRVAQYVTISLGVSILIPSQQVTTNDLIRKADYALYQAKRKGRNCFIVYAEETKD